MIGSLGAPELAIIGVVVILLFGVGRLSTAGRDLGTSIKEFRRAMRETDDEGQPVADVAPMATEAAAASTSDDAQTGNQGDSKNIF